MNEEDLLGPDPSMRVPNTPPKKPNPLPKPKSKADRPLTAKERNMYKMAKGVWPRDGMMLNEFRRFMGNFRRGGGFR